MSPIMHNYEHRYRLFLILKKIICLDFYLCTILPYYVFSFIYNSTYILYFYSHIFYIFTHTFFFPCIVSSTNSLMIVLICDFSSTILLRWFVSIFSQFLLWQFMSLIFPHSHVILWLSSLWWSCALSSPSMLLSRLVIHLYMFFFFDLSCVNYAILHGELLCIFVDDVWCELCMVSLLEYVICMSIVGCV